MKIQYMSDLHLEFAGMQLENIGADTLVLAGDICKADDIDKEIAGQRVRIFFEEASELFDNVVYVAGNHEFYHGNWVSTRTKLKSFLAQFPNIHFLDRSFVVIDGIKFLGATLWTDLNRGDYFTEYHLKDMMNDYRVIRRDDLDYTRLTPAATAQEHKLTVGYFKEVLDDLPTVVVTHHAPTMSSISDRYKDDWLMSGGYASDLSELILDHSSIKLWFHGHIHSVNDYYVGGTRVLANPRGYPGSESSQYINRVVEI